MCLSWTYLGRPSKTQDPVHPSAAVTGQIQSCQRLTDTDPVMLLVDSLRSLILPSGTPVNLCQTRYDLRKWSDGHAESHVLRGWRATRLEITNFS